MHIRNTNSGALTPTFAVSDLLSWTYKNEFTGLIAVETCLGTVELEMLEGVVGKVGGAGAPAHRLGGLLREFGDVDTEVLDAALSEDSDRRIGHRLCERAGLQGVHIDAALTVQSRRRLIDLFGVSTGRWQLVPKPIDGAAFVDPAAILIEGLRRAPDRELRRVDRALARWSVRVGGPFGVSVDAKARRVLEALASPRSLLELDEMIGDPREVRAVLRAAMLQGTLRFIAETKAPRRRAPRTPSAIAAFLFDDSPSRVAA